MSASPQNAELELTLDVREVRARKSNVVAIENVRRRDALQSLLAFGALRKQVLDNRKLQEESGLPQTKLELDYFVLDEVLQLVAERALMLTGADGIAIALAHGDAIVCRASCGSLAPDAGARINPNSGFSGECLVSGSIVLCDDAETDARVDVAACRNLGARSLLAVPLSARQTVIGLIEAFSSEPYGFNDCDVRSLSLLGELILAAIRPDEEDRLAEISKRAVAKKPENPAGWPGTVAEIAQLTATEKQAETVPVPLQPTTEPLSAEEKLPEITTAMPDLAGYATAQKPISRWSVVAAGLCFAVLAGSGWLWFTHKTAQVRAEAIVESKLQTGRDESKQFDAASASGADLSPNGAEDSQIEVEPSAKPGEITVVSGIRHWTSNDSSTVVVDLGNHVQYEAHRLSAPDRIYFDLHDTKLAAGLPGKAIDVEDAFVQRIRVGQSADRVTRVVLETKGAPDFAVSLEQNPFRLVVEIHKAGTKPKDRAKVDLFAPMSPPASTKDAALSPATPVIAPKAASAPIAPAASSSLRIALDAGHGGWDLGTVGKSGLLEKDLVLDIVARLGKLVESRLAATVIYTRQNDDYVPLEKRAEIANVAHVDLFLSVHANYSDSVSARGVETYYSNTYSSIKARDWREDDPALKNISWTNVDIREKVRDSHRFAASVQHALFGTLSAGTPDLPNRGVKEAQYVVLTGTSMPAVLTEVSFVSSPTDEGNLKNPAYRQEIAEALYQGVAHFAKDTSRVNVASAKPAK